MAESIIYSDSKRQDRTRRLQRFRRRRIYYGDGKPLKQREGAADDNLRLNFAECLLIRCGVPFR